MLAQRAAELCGRDTRSYARDSQLASRWCVELPASRMLATWAVQLYGRWALLSSLKLYVEPVLGHFLGGAHEKVLSGHEEVKMLDRPEPRPRIFNMHRAKEAVQRLARELQALEGSANKP